MRLYSYVVKNDSGFAPNPFWGLCTLATCKPVIRRKAEVGDWVVGTGSANEGRQGRLVYAMKIHKTIAIEKYGNSYKNKMPHSNGTPFRIYGDNIYYLKNERWQLRKNLFHNQDNMEHDISGLNVLIGKEFYYFGSEDVEIPDMFQNIIKKGPYHKSKFSEQFVQDFIYWLRSTHKNKRGRSALPRQFNSHYTGRCKEKL